MVTVQMQECVCRLCFPSGYFIFFRAIGLGSFTRHVMPWQFACPIFEFDSELQRLIQVFLLEVLPEGLWALDKACKSLLGRNHVAHMMTSTNLHSCTGMLTCSLT